MLLPLKEEDFTSKYHHLVLNEVHKGNTDILREMRTLYSCHWNIVRAPKTGDTVCHIAARIGYLDIVDTIMTNWDWSPNITNNAGKTPLHEAAQFSKHEIVGHMLKFGGNPSCLKQGDWTPLMLACTKTGKDAYKCVEHLVKLTSSALRAKNKDGWTALHICVRAGDEEIFNLMMQYYNDKDVNEIRTNNGRTLLHIACLHGNLDIVLALLYLGADINAKDSCGQTPLHESIATEVANKELVATLLREGADVYATNRTGLTILHLAAAHASYEIVDYILKQGLNPNVTSSPLNLTPLHTAARAKRKDVVELLRKFGALDVPDSHGRLPNYYFNLSYD